MCLEAEAIGGWGNFAVTGTKGAMTLMFNTSENLWGG
jgi:hypothetical protein